MKKNHHASQDNKVKIRHTLDISQAITEGFFETRSKEKTLFFTLFAIFAQPQPKSATTKEELRDKSQFMMELTGSSGQFDICC